MTNTVYQAKAGDGFKRTGLKRRNSYFNTPQEAIVEALALKEKMDVIYNNEIQWDYQGKITGSFDKISFLKGYLRGDRRTKPFYLQILSLDSIEKSKLPSSSISKKMNSEDKKIFNKVIKLFR
ncbi:hypothetical protein [Halalkalibacter okhensis]|uniref:Uncharacterized protein n=1 Tax=Halalkalibacter okhensis TaxID=333138 RepID=A0A0B0IBP0_9BACI|nr:hypothetical protein [Halalkalibacter okhensis]KHF39983.1 hypothetical protein LQ50_11880 [Halalkalibacter okhensis]